MARRRMINSRSWRRGFATVVTDLVALTFVITLTGLIPAGSASASPAPSGVAHARAMALRAGACKQGTWSDNIGIQPGSLAVWWVVDSDSSTTDGCASIAAEVKDNSGNFTHGGPVWYDNGIQSKATAKDGHGARWSKIIMWINGACKIKTLFSASGPSGWSATSCPSWLT